MPLYHAIVAIYADGGLDRDAMCVNPWFNDTGITTDPDNLADQICDVFVGVGKWCPTTTQIKTSLYLHTPGDPTSGPPAAVKIKNTGNFMATDGYPRETALCLSYYATTNTPRRRGRLYLPMGVTGIGFSLRPGTTSRTRALAVGTGLAGVGGVDVDWVVHSRMDDASYKVTNCWSDDEWDTIRSRGLKPTTRSLLATGS